MPEDLVEEVGRMIGYDSIAPQPPLVPCAPSYDPPEREFLRGIRRLMTARATPKSPTIPLSAKNPPAASACRSKTTSAS